MTLSLSFDDRLTTLLRGYKCGSDSKQVTHVTTMPQGRYTIPDNAYETFMTQLCEVVADGGNHCLREVARDRMPVICNVKIVYDEPLAEGYSNHLLWRLVRLYQLIMAETLDINPENPIQHTCFVLEVDPEAEERYGKTERGYEFQFQFVFPYCRVEATYVTGILIPEVVKRTRANNYMQFFERQPVNNWESIIDVKYFERGVVMYGGIERRELAPLMLTRCYHTVLEDDIVGGDVPNELELDGAEEDPDIRLEFFAAVDKRIFSPTVLEEHPNKRHWLPALFSQGFINQVTLIKEVVKPEATDDYGGGYNDAESTVMQDARRIKIDQLNTIVIPLLKSVRFKDLSYWIDIGKAYYHLFDGDTQGLEMWMKLGETKGRPDVDQCDDWWSDFQSNGTGNITDLTVHWYAYSDPESKEDYKRDRLRAILAPLYDVAMSGADDDLAAAFHATYPFQFLYAGAKAWYHFENHRWQLDVEANRLMTHIGENFRQDLERYRTRLSEKSEKANGFEKRDIEAQLKQVSSIIAKLRNNAAKKRIMESLTRKYMCEKFEEIRDENPNLVVCKNTVIEIRPDRTIHTRQGKPEDYCTKSTGQLYPLQGADPRRLRELDHWMRQIFCPAILGQDQSYYTWQAMYRASLLEGGNAEKLFVQFYGQSHTSKSQYEKILMGMLGEYAIKGPNALILFNTRHDANAATPALSRAAGCRLMFFDELDSTTVIDAGAVRKLSGGDTAYNRDLYQGAKTIKDKPQQQKIAATYNKRPPPNDGSVEAFWERQAVCPFSVRYLYTASADPNEQYRTGIYPRDVKFEVKIKRLESTMLWLAVQDFNTYAKYGLPPCQYIVNAVNEYRAQCDLYLTFINHALLANSDGRVTTRMLYTHFKNWYMQNFPNSKPPAEPFFQNEMKAKNIIPVGNMYSGFDLRADSVDTTDTQRLSGNHYGGAPPNLTGHNTA